jgi:hypothetical protein
MQGTVLRLSDTYLRSPSLFGGGDRRDSLFQLFLAFADASAEQAVACWRPHTPALLQTFAITPTSELVECSLTHLRSWVRDGIEFEPSFFLAERDLAWNAAWANARIAEGIGFALAPIFRAAPKARVSAVIGAHAYAEVDRRCRARWGMSAAARGRTFDVTTWWAVFSMLSDFGCDLQPPTVYVDELRLAFTKTFEYLLNGKF